MSFCGVLAVARVSEGFHLRRLVHLHAVDLPRNEPAHSRVTKLICPAHRHCLSARSAGLEHMHRVLVDSHCEAGEVFQAALLAAVRREKRDGERGAVMHGGACHEVLPQGVA